MPPWSRTHCGHMLNIGAYVKCKVGATCYIFIALCNFRFLSNYVKLQLCWNYLLNVCVSVHMICLHNICQPFIPPYLLVYRIASSLESMPPKAVAKAALKGKAKAKAKSQAKANIKAPAVAKAQPKSAPVALGGRSSRGEAKGWNDIQPGKASMGKLGAMAVMDQLKALARHGNSQPLDTYKSLKGQQKLDFAMQLKIDREASFMTVTENHSMEISNTQSSVSGWLSEAQVAQEVGLINFTTCTIQASQLKDVLEGLPCMPHERPDLAAKGYKLYHYSAKRLNEQSHKTKDTMRTECTAKVDSGQEHDALVDMFQGQSSNFTTMQAQH